MNQGLTSARDISKIKQSRKGILTSFQRAARIGRAPELGHRELVGRSGAEDAALARGDRPVVRSILRRCGRRIVEKLCFRFSKNKLDESNVFFAEARVQNDVDNRVE